VVVGVGLNLKMSHAQADGIGQAWTSLNEVLAANGRDLPDRNAVAAAVADALVRVLQEFAREGFAGFQRRWKEFDAVNGKNVFLEQEGRRWEGRACGIDDDGALLIDSKGRRERFLSGDLSLRMQS
jgi:BirA family biotin operon repressor/biotin-[acetyl-CoA-carboxylase] ligase